MSYVKYFDFTAFLNLLLIAVSFVQKSEDIKM